MQYFNEADDSTTPRKRATKIVEPIEPIERTPADDFQDQVELFYSMPREQSPRSEVKFSPSGATKCVRELYYLNLNAPIDTNTNLTPWKQRIPRNGEGVHEITQRDYLIMHKKLIKAGLPCKFQMLKVEENGRKEFLVDGFTVVINGRCDGILVDTDGIQYIYEKKTKDKLANLKKIKEPTPEHKGQVVCYSLLFDIPRTIFEIESLQKPAWGKDEEDDSKYFYFESTPEMEQALLKRLASVVKAIEAGRAPAPEYDKCMFCSYKDLCRRQAEDNHEG